MQTIVLPRTATVSKLCLRLVKFSLATGGRFTLTPSSCFEFDCSNTLPSTWHSPSCLEHLLLAGWLPPKSRPRENCRGLLGKY